ncbi:hypothetical protein BDW42DRAFT_128093 [Aspergillus taichungensis]|uniref:Protein kinase domain-containing protein n=1 Tax=Aspergillus taichungensis TaxID=482145 RepID=A0A2J5HQD7_9EURO|nr:hypothetical protein BDW42DRAFT_128093 [Aspergillus taichungensis]
MDDPTDYKALFVKAEEARKQAEEGRKQAEEARKQAEERERQQEQRNQRTTFKEFIQHCHDLLSRPLRVENPDQSTTGDIPPPTGKYCPLRMRPWTECATRQREIYNSVCRYLQPMGRDAPRLFLPLIVLEDYGKRFARRPISSEKDLESYERFAVEDHVHDIIAELCKIPNARDEFGLGDGVWFDNHGNALEEDDDEPEATAPPNARPSRPDQFCIHRVNGNTRALLTTVEYKPPHKLSVENLRAGLRPIDFYREIIESDTIPTDGPEKLRYNATRLTGSAIVQEYHVMIQEGLEYSYLTTGLGNVQLRIPYDDPGTLYYDLGEPNLDADTDVRGFQGPTTEIARVLCLCLMSCRSQLRDQVWRNNARADLPIWETNFSHTRSQIPVRELQQKPPDSDYTSSEPPSPGKTISDYQPSSSPVESPVAKGRRVPTRSLAGCAPSDVVHREDSSDSDADTGAAARRKRGFSQITSSPPAQRSMSSPQTNPQSTRGGQSRPHDNKFCTQRCLLGLQRGGTLDARCPNVELHQCGKNSDRHPISADNLVQMLNQQLDEDPDCGCTPMGGCGSYGAPFKVTCSTYGYTVVGKGTTLRRWKEVSHEAEIYRVLRRVQASAVPVFLGTIDLAQIYFLHGAGEIRHMLLMGWGGENVRHVTRDDTVQRAISRSERRIRRCGVIHGDLRPENILWNTELNQALVIDFHRCTLDHRLMHQRPQSVKRLSCGTGESGIKRVRAV